MLLVEIIPEIENIFTVFDKIENRYGLRILRI